ncbi:MAG: family 78 glycoside hydrolase catalytic domain [Clostridia bacterium]|nr:family 78 glycoside hydrolase catalytic domain [Clostridia bacterium]
MFSKKFISATKNYSTQENKIPAPYIRKTFNLKDFSTAEIYVCGLGFYEIYVNGQNITKGKFAPYISNPNQVCYYDKYDLSPYLKKGKNVFAFILGNGFLNNEGGKPWHFDEASYRSAPKLALSFIVDGKLLFEADKSFRWAPSPIIYDDYRIGEEYDGQKEIKGWAEIDFDDSKWKKCIKATTPKGVAKLCTANPIKCTKIVKPVKIWRTECGNVFDFGANYTGVVELNLKEFYAPHQRFILHHGEILLDNRVLYQKNICVPFLFDLDKWQTDIYWTKDDGSPEIYEPHFTYHGFRYVFVEGIDGAQATPDFLTLKVYHSDFEDQSEFSCNDQVANKIQQMTVEADKGNFQYFPTDCPHREKNGWLGDAALSAEQLYYNFGCGKDIREWLTNIALCQNEQGAIPGIVPTAEWGYEWGNGPVEDFAITELPYFDYKTYGKKELLHDLAPHLKKYFKYVKECKVKENGLLEYGIPDWCEARWEGLKKPNTPIEITDTLVVIGMLEKAKTIFTIIGDTDYVKQLDEFANQLRATFRKTWVDQNLFVTVRKQTAQARAISAGIFSQEELKKAVDNLIEIINEDGGVMQVGVAGARVLFEVLADNGHHDLALKLITQDKFPSYYDWVKRGFTTLAEEFYELADNSTFPRHGGYLRSHNHHFWGFVSGFFYKYIAGLKVNPDMNSPLNLVINPLVFEGINKVNCTYNKMGKSLKYTVEITDGKPNVQILENTGFTVTVI